MLLKPVYAGHAKIFVKPCLTNVVVTTIAAEAVHLRGIATNILLITKLPRARNKTTLTARAPSRTVRASRDKVVLPFVNYFSLLVIHLVLFASFPLTSGIGY